jgi:hypothetical protein
MIELSNNDYKKILDYYKTPIPHSKRLLEMHAEQLLATKLCRCIKKVDKLHEARAIGICTKTIINSKGFKRGKFKCKGKRTIKLKKKTSKKNSTRRSRG